MDVDGPLELDGNGEVITGFYGKVWLLCLFGVCTARVARACACITCLAAGSDVEAISRRCFMCMVHTLSGFVSRFDTCSTDARHLSTRLACACVVASDGTIALRGNRPPASPARPLARPPGGRRRRESDRSSCGKLEVFDGKGRKGRRVCVLRVGEGSCSPPRLWW